MTESDYGFDTDGFEGVYGSASSMDSQVFGQEFGGYGEESVVRQFEQEPDDDFWLTDGIEGLGLGVLGAVEGILELGSIIPGIDYDIPDNFGLGHAETGFGQFVEGMTSFFAPFLVPGAGWVAGGAKIGKGTQLLQSGSRIAKAAGMIEGGTYGLGKYIANDKLQLTKFTNKYLGRDWMMRRKATLAGPMSDYAATGMFGKAQGMGLAVGGKIVGQVPEMVGAGIGGAIVDFSVWDPHEDRLSNMIQSVPGLANPVTEFLAADEMDSELLGRVKQTIEGFGMGFAVDGIIGGIKGLWAAKRVYNSTGDSVKAAHAFRREKIENDVARRSIQFNLDRDTAIHAAMFNLGIDPERIQWDTVAEDIERQLFQGQPVAEGLKPEEVPESLRGLLSPDDIRLLNVKAVQAVEQLVESSLDGGLDTVVLREMALAGQAVRGEYARMGEEILPALFPAQAGRTKDDGVLWTALNAILSPNQQVDTHTGASMAILSAWRAAGRPTQKVRIKALLDDALGATGADDKSLKGMREHQKTVLKLLMNADRLKSDSEVLDYVNKKLIKTREFAGGYIPGWFSGIALDVHMGHILDSRVWSTATSLYNKTVGKYSGVGATAYRALIRRTADELGWRSGTEVQEAAWAAIAAVKGLLQHFRGNVDDVMDNLHGQLVTQLWDHNVVLKELMENERFSELMRAGGASDESLAQMKAGEGLFAPRQVAEGVPEFDREAVRKGIDTIQQYTYKGSSSGAPGRMLRMIRDFTVEQLEKIGISAPGPTYEMLRGTGYRVSRVIDSNGRAYDLPETQGSVKMRQVYYYEETHGLPDTFRERQLEIPRAEEVAEATTGAASKVANAAVEEGKAVSVAYDTTASTVIRTSGGGKALSAREAVTLKDVNFDVSGKKPLVKGKMVEGELSGTGVPVRYDGKFFVTGNGYAIRAADEVTMAGDKAYVRGTITYWDVSEAFGVVKAKYRQLRMPNGEFTWVDKESLDNLTPKTYDKLSKAERDGYVASLDSKGDPDFWYKPETVQTRPAVVEGLEDQKKAMGYREGVTAPPVGVPVGQKGQTKFLFQEVDEGSAKGVTIMDEAGRIFMAGLQNSDSSTALHELLHAWRLIGVNRTLRESDRAAMGGLRDFEIDALEAALGMKPGDEWTDEMDELLAAYWEKYIWEGVLPQGAETSARDFDVLQMAMAKLSQKQRQIYEGIEAVLPMEKIPDEIRNIFDGAVNRSDVQGVMDSLGDEALRLYGQPLSKAGRGIGAAEGEAPKVTEIEQALKDFDVELQQANPDYPPGLAFKSDKELRADPAYQALSQGEKIKLGHRRAAWKRQQDTAESAARGVESRAERLHAAQGEVQAAYNELDRKFPEGWDEATLDAKELRGLQAARAKVAQIESGRVPFASEAAEPQRQRGRDVPDTGFPGARRDSSLPLNVRRTVTMPGENGVEDIANADIARDLFEQHVREEEAYLDSVAEADREWIVESEKRYYSDLSSAMRRGTRADVERLFDINTKDGRRFMARSRAIRSFAADVFGSAQDAEARLAAGEAAGNAKDIALAKSDFLYWTSLYEPLAKQLKSISNLKGRGLADQAEVPFAEVTERATSLETAQAAIMATERALQNARGGAETVDEYIARLRVAMKEGELALGSAATSNGGDKLDAILEIFYNSLLSGPRTHAVNTLSNTIYGIMMHGSRRVGRKALQATGLTDEFAGGGKDVKKMVSTIVGLRTILKESFAIGRIAMREGVAQYDSAGSRAAFDSTRGVYSGKTNRDYVKRFNMGGRANELGERTMPQPLKGLLNGIFNTVSVGGWPTRLLGGMDEVFKQMHSRLVVTEELTRRAVKAFPDDAAAQANYITSEFQTIIGDGNHYTLKRIKRDGLQEAYAKGLDKAAARRYMQDYVKKNHSQQRQALADKALEFSRRSTFTLPAEREAGRNLLSAEIYNLGRALQNFTGEVRYLRFLAPFINTPTNLMAEAADMLVSPISDGIIPGVKKLKQLIQRDVEGFRSIQDPEETADAIGRLAMSSSIISLVWMKANSGEITGGGPKDPNAQRLLREAGWQPYSVRFGDSYFGYGRLDPLASVMGIVADIAEGFNGNPYTDDPEEEGIKALMMGATMAIFRNMGEKSYLSGMINFASAIDNPEYYGKTVGFNMGGAVVPNLSAQVAGQLDPTLREVRDLTDKWKTRVPFLGGDLMPKRNFMGEPMEKMQHLGGPLLGLFSPIPHSQVSSDKIAMEAAKFGEIMSPPEPVKFGTMDLREYGAYDRYQELQGEVNIDGRTMRQALEGLIDSNDYQRMPDFAGDGASSPKMDALRKTVTRYRTQAWKELIQEFPMLKQNYDITMYNRSARKAGRPEHQLLDLIR